MSKLIMPVIGLAAFAIGTTAFSRLESREQPGLNASLPAKAMTVSADRQAQYRQLDMALAEVGSLMASVGGTLLKPFEAEAGQDRRPAPKGPQPNVTIRVFRNE